MLKSIFFAAALAVAGTAQAEIIEVQTDKAVSDAADALVAAVEGAGAKVFARVNHGAGAASVDMALADAELLIFGNPMLGTPAMQDDMLAGLFLPLRVLVYADEAGQTWLAYEAPSDMLGDLDVPGDAKYLQMMTGALGKLTRSAAN